MFRSPLRSIWAFISAFLSPRLGVMGWDDALIAALISAVATTGSAAVANQARNRQIEAEEAIKRRDRFKQAELQRQSDAALRNTIQQQFAPEQLDADVSQAVGTRLANVAPATAAPPAAYTAAPVSAPREVKSDLERRLGTAASDARADAERRARLAAFGDASMVGNQRIGRVGEQLRRFQLESRGQSNVLPYDIAGIDNTRNNRRADIANVIGGIGNMYALQYGKPKGIGYGSIDPTQSGWPGTPY